MRRYPSDLREAAVWREAHVRKWRLAIAKRISKRAVQCLAAPGAFAA